RVQALSKCDVAFAASQATSLFEIGLAETAHRARLRGRSLFDFLCRSDAKQQIGESEARGILHTFFFRASFAQIHLVHLALQNLCQEDRRIIAFANVAQHLSSLDLDSW